MYIYMNGYTCTYLAPRGGGAHIRTYVYTHALIYIYMYTCKYTYIYVYVYPDIICLYIYLSMYTNTYRYICTYLAAKSNRRAENLFNLFPIRLFIYSLYEYIFWFIFLYIYTYIYMTTTDFYKYPHKYVCIYIHMCISFHACQCVYIPPVYINMHIYIHICVFYVHVFSQFFLYIPYTHINFDHIPPSLTYLRIYPVYIEICSFKFAWQFLDLFPVQTSVLVVYLICHTYLFLQMYGLTCLNAYVYTIEDLLNVPHTILSIYPLFTYCATRCNAL